MRTIDGQLGFREMTGTGLTGESRILMADVWNNPPNDYSRKHVQVLDDIARFESALGANATPQSRAEALQKLRDRIAELPDIQHIVNQDLQHARQRLNTIRADLTESDEELAEADRLDEESWRFRRQLRVVQRRMVAFRACRAQLHHGVSHMPLTG